MADDNIIAQRRSNAAAAICVTCVGIVFLLLLWVAITIATGGYRGDIMPGSGLLLLMDNHGTLATAGKSIPFLLGFGASCLASSKIKDRAYYAIIALCFVSILLSLTFLFLLRDSARAHLIYDYSTVATITDSKSYKAGLDAIFLPLTAWLVGTLAVQLGIKLGSDGSPVTPTPSPAPAPAPAPTDLPNAPGGAQ